MDYTAQNNLKRFEEVDILSKTPTGWTSTQAANYLKEWIELKRLSQVEINANTIESEQQAESDRLERRQQLIAYLQNKGFTCDNSLSDWQKLYNYPKIFGNNWNEKAIYQYNLAKDFMHYQMKDQNQV